MAQSHTFRTVDGSVWNQDDAGTALSFTIEDENVTNVALSDSINDSYVTAIGENTQYLSVLETSHGDITLSSLHQLEMNEENAGIATEENTLTNIDIGGQQVMVFTMEGSDDLYGIQLAEDTEGNLQKFQFKFRTTEDGQLEAIPESIQLLPIDESDLVVTDQASVAQEEENGNIYITKNAQPKKLYATEDVLEADEAVEMEEEQTDSKIGILEQINIKREINNEENDEEMLFNNEEEENYHHVINYSVDETYEGEETAEQHLDMYTTAETDEEQAYNEIFVEEGSNLTSENEETDHLTDTEYEIVEGVHITGDVVGGGDEMIEEEPVLQQMLVKNAENIVNNKTDTILKENNQNNRAFLYYVVPQPEKENVNSIQTTTLYKQIEKPNPRSILKSSYAVQQPAVVKNDSFQFQKRFARSKQAVEARQFHNFISNTSIVQAPTRSERLPRKQQIKPVNERSDEEIIVKEVMVSKNSFVEDVNKEQSNGYVEYIDLSDDSDEEYDPKGKKRRRLGNKRVNDGCSSESDVSVIEIASDEENESRLRSGKRPRGRPPKQTVDNKKEFKCPDCPKAFPSTNSLNTHVQHHSLENRLRSQVNKREVFELRYKCERCEQKFKNSVLLKRHECRFECKVCSKWFEEEKRFQNHKLWHSKQRLLRNTSLVAVSPRKIRASAVNSTRFRCNVCLKGFANEMVLKAHEKCHKMFECKTCSKSFSSQILLNAHVRSSCMKKRNQSPIKQKRPSSVAFVACNECEMKFKTNELLVRHKRCAHRRYTSVQSGVPMNSRLRMAIRKGNLEAAAKQRRNEF